jgi:hypothetical protein
MIRRVLAVLAASVVVSGATATAALAEYPPTSGSGSVSATTLQAGGDVTFSGGGFKAGSKVTISVDDAVYSTVVADVTATASLDRSAQVHIGNAAFVRNAAATAASAGFTTSVTVQTAGAHVLTGSGIAPSGAARVVTAKVTVAKAPGTPTTTAGSSLPFTGSSVVISGLVVGLAMMGGGFLLLTTVRSRRAGQARS